MKNLYLGYGCLNATISGRKLIIDCWTTATSMVVSKLHCTLLKGEVTSTQKISEGDSESWKDYVSPNTYFVLDIQGQHEVVFYWDGNTIFEIANAWFGGGEKCFTVGYKGSTGNKNTRRKKMSIFNVETIRDWSGALKALEIVNFV